MLVCYSPHKDLVTSKSMDLLGITETWLTTRETSADMAKMTTPPGFLLLSINQSNKLL